MIPEMQNPGVQARASRDLLCVGWSHPLSTVSDWQAQTLVARFGLSPWMARSVAELHFGSGCHD